jgi:hypothetical protein
MGGGSEKTSTTTIRPSPPSRSELRLQRQQIRLGEQQAAAIDRATNFTAEFLKQQALTEISLLQQQGEINSQTGEIVSNENEQLLADSAARKRIVSNQTLFGEDASSRSLGLRPIEDELLATQVNNVASIINPGENEQILTDLARTQSEASGQVSRTIGESADIALENLRSANRSPEEIRALIGEEADLRIEGGLSDIESFSRRLGTQLRTVIAPSRGLRPGDSPILDRAGEIQRTGVEQGAQLIRDIRSAQTRANIDVPGQIQERVGSLSAQNINSANTTAAGAGSIATAGADTENTRKSLVASAAGGQQNLIAAGNQFQQQLADAAAANRLALTGSFNDTVGNAAITATGLATGINPNIAGALGSEKQFRASVANRTTNETEKKSAGVGEIFGGVGGFLTGVAAVSSKDYKTNKRPVTILDKLASVPVEAWEYIWDKGVIHIGPYAEDFNAAFGIGQKNPKVIQIIDYLGVLLGSVKELNDKMERIEHAA